MTITRHPPQLLRGLSSDTKPITNILTSTIFEETDTKKRFSFDATNSVWVPVELEQVKKYMVEKVGARFYILDQFGSIKQSNTDLQIAMQAQLDSMVHGDWFHFDFDIFRPELTNPIALPKSISFTTLKMVSMNGYRSGRTSSVTNYGTQFTFASTFPTGRCAIEGLCPDAEVSEYIMCDIDGFGFDNRAYQRRYANDGTSVGGNPTVIDAGAIHIRNAGMVNAVGQGVNIRNIYGIYLWRTLHLQGGIWFPVVENIITEDNSGSGLPPGAVLGDSHIILQASGIATNANALPGYGHFRNIKYLGHGVYNSWLRLRSSKYNVFYDVFPDGGRYKEAVFNLDNSQDNAIDSGYVVAGNKFDFLRSLDLLDSTGTEQAVLYLNGAEVRGNTFKDSFLPNYPSAVKFAGGAQNNNIELSGHFGATTIINDAGAGAGNTITLLADFKNTASVAIATTNGIVRIIDNRGIAFNGGDELISDGTHWWLKGAPSMLSRRKWGGIELASSNLTGFGLLGGTSFANATGATPSLVNDTTNGRRLNCPTPATTGSKGGIRMNSTVLVGAFDFKLRIRLKLASTTNMRLYSGVMPNSEPTGDDPLGTGNAGVLFGFTSADANFQWMRNDNAGVTVFQDTGIAKDTNMHDIRIVVTGGGTTYSVSLDGGAYTNFTTNIPSTSTALTVMIQSETSENVAKTFEIYNVFIQTEK